MPQDGSHTCCKFGNILIWLDGLHDEKADNLHRQILLWLQVVGDYDCFWDRVSADPLAVALHTTRKGMARIIPTLLKEAVAREAARGKLGRSGAKILELVKRFRFHNKNAPLRFNIGNTRVEPTLRRYLGQLQLEMRQADQPIYPISWDATRLSGKDLLFSTMYAPSARLAC